MILPAAGLKRFAARVATLAEVDREWLLMQLPTADRRRLEALVAEARRIGLDRDASLVAELTDAELAGRSIAPARDPEVALPAMWRELAQTLRAPGGGEEPYAESPRGQSLRRCLLEWAARNDGAQTVSA